MTWTTVSRWERGQAAPHPKGARKLARMRELIELIGEAIRREDLPRFLTVPHPELRGHSPVDLLDNEYSFEAVKSPVLAAQSGAYR